jgi:organic radical activating enzyme
MSGDLRVPDRTRDIPLGTVVSLAKSLRARGFSDGFTISGGEPLDQAAELIELLERLRAVDPDILVFSGYTAKEMSEKLPPAQEWRLYRLAAALVLGPYVHALNDKRDPLRGSTNQEIIIRPAFRAKYARLMDGTIARRAQIAREAGGTEYIVTGMLGGERLYAEPGLD